MSKDGIQKTAPSAAFSASAHIDAARYAELYAQSVNDPVAFWGEQGKILDWIEPYTQVKQTCFDFGRVDIKWFADGVLNASVNCIDRHLEKRSLQTAIIFEPDDPEAEAQHITYKELSEKVNRMANVLLSQGVMRGDRVVIYLPMIPEAAYAMLACARIGAIHSIVFAGFSPMRWPTGSTTVKPRSSSPPTRPHVAGAARRSRPIPTPPFCIVRTRCAASWSNTRAIRPPGLMGAMWTSNC